MARRLPSTCVWLVPALLFVTLAAGCGGDAGTNVQTPPPPVGSGPAVRGAVFMPNGQLSQRTTLLERFASIGVREAEALAAANILAVGRNVEVRLWQSGSPVLLGKVFTQDQGLYRVDLPVNVTADACPRLLVAVGSGSTETRAFVYDTSGSVDIDYQSEAAVRLIESQITTTPGASTCSYTPGQIRDVVNAIRSESTFVPGNNTGQLNQNAFDIARVSEPIMEKVTAPFGGPATPTTGPTSPPPPTRTFTTEPTPPTPPTNTRTPTSTFTRVPTSTPSQVVAATSTPTQVIAATSTPTQIVPATNTPTQVVPPSNTPTQIIAATNTPTQVVPPTNTATQVIPPTETPTQVVAATNTPTQVVAATETPTQVVVATNTPTQVAPPTDTPTQIVGATNTPTQVAAATDTPTQVVVATDTPTQVVVATSTPTQGAPPTDTPTQVVVATNTPTQPAGTATPSATPTATTGSVTTPTVFIVHLRPGGGSGGNCRGQCVLGDRAGQACGLTTDCKTCTAGTNKGKTCNVVADCPGSGSPKCEGTCGGTKTCVGGPFDGQTCANSTVCNGCTKDPRVGSCAVVQTTAFPLVIALNGVCSPRKFPPGDVACATDAECRTCAGGSNSGNTCLVDSSCPGSTCTGHGTCLLNQVGYTIGDPDPVTKEATFKIPKDTVKLNAALAGSIGTVCVSAGGDGQGVIDCDGGRPNLDATFVRDHNTTPQVCLSGTNKGNACTTDADCPGAITFPGPPSFLAGCNLTNSGTANGLPDDPTCTSKFTEPDQTLSFACLEGAKQCGGGVNGGKVCMNDNECPLSSCSFCSSASVGGVSNGGLHPGVCNSPSQLTLAGTFRTGDISIALPLSLLRLPAVTNPPPADYGPDGLACTADDIANPPAGVPVALSTGTNIVRIHDAGNDPTQKGQTLTASLVGVPAASCSAVGMGNIAGISFGGGFAAVDIEGAGDIATVFQFVLQP